MGLTTVQPAKAVLALGGQSFISLYRMRIYQEARNIYFKSIITGGKRQKQRGRHWRYGRINPLNDASEDGRRGGGKD
jgi:hypothetical protein